MLPKSLAQRNLLRFFGCSAPTMRSWKRAQSLESHVQHSAVSFSSSRDSLRKLQHKHTPRNSRNIPTMTPCRLSRVVLRCLRCVVWCGVVSCCVVSVMLCCVVMLSCLVVVNALKHLHQIPCHIIQSYVTSHQKAKWRTQAPIPWTIIHAMVIPVLVVIVLVPVVVVVVMNLVLVLVFVGCVVAVALVVFVAVVFLPLLTVVVVAVAIEG